MNRPLYPLLALVAVLACAFQPEVSSAQSEDGPPLVSASADKVKAAVDAVQSFYDRSRTFKADFDQNFTMKAYATPKSSRGHVTFAKPGKMDWVYDDPKGNRVVCDGNLIKVYEASTQQMYEQPVGKSQYPVALSFLTGTGKLTDGFDFQLFPGQAMKFPGGDILVGTPKDPTPAYAKVLFYVDTPTSQVRRVLIIDGQGNRNRFDFSNPRINEPPAAGQFSFTPPAGTTVVHP